MPSDWLERFKSCFEQQGAVAVGGAYQACNKDKSLSYATSILDQILNVVFKKSLIPNKLSGVNSIFAEMSYCISAVLMRIHGGVRIPSWAGS